MNRKTFFALMALSFILTWIYQLSSIKAIGYTIYPQSNGCGRFETFTNDCGNSSTCGNSSYNYDVLVGPGVKGLRIVDVPCPFTTCEAVQNVPRAFDNPEQCCDQDLDGYNGSGCGGDDCNDGNKFINPGEWEDCTNGKDDDCDGKVDNADPDCDSCGGTCLPPHICFHSSCITPIIIDVRGNGIDLTDGRGGVVFDILATGIKKRVSWTIQNSDDAWLGLDRNGNGVIDSSEELFGTLTQQPPSNEPNGFLALAEYDKRRKGGNNDGVIDRSDAIFSSLKLWQDINHDGISEPNELLTLSSKGVTAIGLDYKLSRRTDQYGNTFRYRARVLDSHGAHVGQWAWDVLLVKPQ